MSSDMDETFGPRLFGHFDFTLLFEHAIFELAPACLILFVVPLYLHKLWKGKPCVRCGSLLWAKLALAAALVGLHIANAVLWCNSPLDSTLAKVAGIMSCVSAACIIVIVLVGHVYFLHSPGFLGLFLSVSLLFDVAITRTYFNRNCLATLARVHAPIPVLKLALVVLEEVSKRSLIRAEYLRLSLGHEAVAGFWNRSIFFWVNATLLIGFRSNITQKTLGNLDPHFDSEKLQTDFRRIWENGDKHKSKHALLIACLCTVPWLFVLIIPPRLFYIGFSYAQPFLLQEVVRFISEEAPDPAAASGLIGAAALVFFCKGVARGWYNHYKNQIMTCVRGILIGAIYRKSLRLGADDLASAAAVTLMSTDVNGVERLITLSYESWARLLEIGSGIGILGRFIRPSCVFTLIPAIIAAICSSQLARIMSRTRINWNQHIESRVAATSNVLAQLKDVKMMGLAPAMARNLHEMHDAEVKASLRDRATLSGVFALSAFVETVTPAVVVAATIFWTRRDGALSVELFFTILAVVTMVTNPLAAVLSSISFWSTGFASISRIQQYLLKREPSDTREFEPEQSLGSRPSSISSLDSVLSTGTADQGLGTVRNRRRSRQPRFAVEMSDVSVTMDTSAPILREVSVKIPRRSMTMIFGRVGSGKSTMLKTILGEIEPRRGVIKLGSRSVSYCGQVPWILNDTIENNIVGANVDGRNLSGGQKQRIALARAVYDQADIMLLDDVFCSLDAETSSDIRVRLFSQTAILNSTTLIMTTNATEHLVDATLALGITHTGHVREISNSGREISPSCIPASVMAERERILPPSVADEKNEAPAVAATEAQPTTLPFRKYGDYSLYSFYLSPAGWQCLTFWLALIVIAAVAEKMPFIFGRLWFDRAPNNPLFFVGFAILSVANPVFNMMASSAFFYLVNPSASKSLHWKLADTTSRATLDFLSQEDAGALLNRFSQDMTLISQRLPLAILPASWMGLTVLMDIAIIASGASFAAPILPFIVIVVGVIQHFYLQTSRQLRILELDTSKNLYKHFTESASGAVHIRAYRWQPTLTQEFNTVLDETQKPFYALFCVQQWLILTLDVVTTVAAVSVVGLAVKYTSHTSDTAMGLAFLSLITFSETASLFIQTWVETETCLGGVARVRDFATSTPVEEPCMPGPDLPDGWPRYGKIDFNCVDATYQLVSLHKFMFDIAPANARGDRVNGPRPYTALHNATLQVRPGEKIVIAGRTGSGKTSLLLALLNLIQYSGSISIDDRELRITPRDVLRTRITTIPQSAVQFKGTIRYNLNPFDPLTFLNGFEVTDGLLIGILQKVGLWNLIEARGGLDADMGKMELSQGQKQLLQLGRAILHHQSVGSRIVVVDEGWTS
ncbi:ABC transporter, transmembrane domain, type 1 [Cordyceps fumosorosea ARSEF 2679]|uniref:ABC transporter, transmembrane domain, type 1 n=1 Tax=Cordyceps fumosorosea (strain ARSEF 2679) TaxID=1081104 RepID=A0A167NK53_CORFA|nr:ABC transporter, transmembrane domain, type 1 [Cordyceps fumosorosea ARSEF 2679]OAA55637.1 ABC transporter, transmembrane domain, type 1 [Cordyceps fumosorosea ARSEF 2679]